MVTKVVPVRAVNFSIGAFCTEFRCESIRDDDVFSDWGREIDHRGQEIVFFSHIFSKRFNRFTGEVQAGSNWKEPVCELAELGIHWANLFETNSNWNSNSLTPRFTMRIGRPRG